ncbi:asialoglycoprotein receptor 2-like [Boleophthalmus pectinirostris]|uniref:asialoglycoprotein receptor 2-like n=1 Tax=Boleophthalmus pectinirostris TaxID=150288 RepID=UPI00242F4D21|nr:asialoglycoprotein receptor 2-like [Boleophthalmus pectinirostris]
METEQVYMNVEEAAEWADLDEDIYENSNVDLKKCVTAPSEPCTVTEPVHSSTSDRKLSTAPSEDEPRAHRGVVWTVVIVLLSALLLAALVFIVLTKIGENTKTSQMKMWITNLTSERDELQERNIDMKTSNYNLSAQINLLEENIQTLDGDRNKLRKELQDLKERHADLRRIMETISCPKTWVRFGNSIYLVSQIAKNWTDSRQHCEELRASLVIISSPEEQAFVSKLTFQNVWIGLTDRETEGVWKWVNGEAVNTTHWRPNQPDNWGEEDCGEISFDKLWNDRDCSEKKHFVCEKQIPGVCNCQL